MLLIVRFSSLSLSSSLSDSDSSSQTATADAAVLGSTVASVSSVSDTTVSVSEISSVSMTLVSVSTGPSVASSVVSVSGSLVSEVSGLLISSVSAATVSVSPVSAVIVSATAVSVSSGLKLSSVSAVREMFSSLSSACRVSASVKLSSAAMLKKVPCGTPVTHMSTAMNHASLLFIFLSSSSFSVLPQNNSKSNVRNEDFQAFSGIAWVQYSIFVFLFGSIDALCSFLAQLCFFCSRHHKKTALTATYFSAATGQFSLPYTFFLTIQSIKSFWNRDRCS